MRWRCLAAQLAQRSRQAKLPWKRRNRGSAAPTVGSLESPVHCIRRSDTFRFPVLSQGNMRVGRVERAEINTEAKPAYKI